MVQREHQQRLAEAVNNIQTTRRMAREFRNIDYFITMVYLCNDRLEISFNRMAVPIAK